MREMKDSGIEWIGEIPKEWKIIRMKNMIVSREGGAWGEDKANNENDVICLRIADFDYSKLRFKDSNQLTIRNYKPEIKKRLLLSQDDILLEKSGGGEKTPVGRAVIFDKKYEALFANFMERLRTNKNTNPKYFLYILTAFYQNKHMLNYIKQTTGIQNLDINSLLSIEYSSFPPTTEQQKISAYLDDKCTKIDSIIEKQEKVIEKLKAYKLSVLTEAVTKGLNPDVKMKESGVQWIGEIPEDWEQTALKVGLADIQTGPFGSQLHAEDYIENGIYVINPANIINGKIVIDSKCSISYEKANELAQHLLSVGDIVFARRGEMGRCACALDDGIQKLCGTGCIKLKCNDRLIPKYIILYLQTHYIKQYLELNSVGTTMLNLNSTIISNIPILIPPISEQQQIVNYLDKKCSAIDKSIEQKQAIIEKLKEYKKSLIYEVVTGKREV